MTYLSSLFLALPFGNQKIFEDNQLDGFKKKSHVYRRKKCFREKSIHFTIIDFRSFEILKK